MNGSTPTAITPAMGEVRQTARGTHDAACYHCGQSVPRGPELHAVIGGLPRAMCCAGCVAVAEAIVGNGLEDYYRNRDRFPESPREAIPAVVSDLLVFDREEIQRGFVRDIAVNEREAALILDGIHCPACIWLNEAHVARQPGVIAIHVNYTTRRATVRWDTRSIQLSGILAAIQAIGYRAFPYDPGAMETSRKRERRDALLRLAIAGLGMMQIMMYAYPAYVSGEAGVSADALALMHWASLILTCPVVFYSSLPFFRGALRDLKQRRTGMDVPVALGIGTAFIGSVAATVTQHGAVYFDSIAMFVFFLLGGRYLELHARHRAAAYLEYLGRAMPAVARRFCDAGDTGAIETIPAAALRPGDRVLVRPGENFPADGCIESGDTQADQALLTGESSPIAKHVGDTVIGGSLNRGNPVTVRVERIGADTVLSGIVRLMERGMQQRPPLQQFADRIAGQFVALVLAIAAAAALYWMWVDPARALPVAIAVLVVTCPCALSLATPMTMAVATAAMARLGIVVTRGQAIETLARATHFVFDKTGTLTEGRLQLVQVHLLGNADHYRAIALAAALESRSEHPLGKAIVAAAADQPLAVSGIRNFPGQGIEGRVDGRRLRIGQKKFVAELGPTTFAEESASSATSVWLGDEQGALAQFLLEDRVRDDACELVSDLRAAGHIVMLLSGDGTHAVRAAAASAGIPYQQARMLPDQKLAAVKQMQQDGAVVAMIGDGINDAPVLAQAQVSIAMGSGAPLAQGAADMVLISPRLSDLGRGLRLARKT
ncbi:MAG TPA: heavy metal translocating P-type ATPase, partial [Burkholderiales bacterium]|nr:heavy metal translocating P-type ATPase [Burkholderiales bacterium]